MKRTLPPFGLLIIVVAIYAYGLQAPLIFEDAFFVRGNSGITNFLNLPLLFRANDGEMWPLVNFTLALNYAWDGYAPLSYHLFNGLLYAGIGYVLFLLLHRLGKFTSDAIPFALAALFVAQPAHVEAVQLICGRGGMFAWGLVLLSIYLYHCAASAPLHGRFLYVLSWLAGFLAQGAGELAMILPALIFSMEWVILRKRRWLPVLVFLPQLLVVPCLLHFGQKPYSEVLEHMNGYAPMMITSLLLIASMPFARYLRGKWTYLVAGLLCAAMLVFGVLAHKQVRQRAVEPQKVELASKDPRALLAQAFILKEVGKVPEAMAYAKAALLLAKMPLKVDVLNYLAQWSIEMKNLDVAAAYLNEAIATGESLQVPYTMRAKTMIAIGYYAEALGDLDFAVKIDPQYASGHYFRGVALQHLQRDEEAQAAFQTALWIDRRLSISRVGLE